MLANLAEGASQIKVIGGATFTAFIAYGLGRLVLFLARVRSREEEIAATARPQPNKGFLVAQVALTSVFLGAIGVAMSPLTAAACATVLGLLAGLLCSLDKLVWGATWGDSLFDTVLRGAAWGAGGLAAASAARVLQTEGIMTPGS